MLEFELNPYNYHQGCLDIDQIPIIIIKDAWTQMKCLKIIIKDG